MKTKGQFKAVRGGLALLQVLRVGRWDERVNQIREICRYTKRGQFVPRIYARDRSRAVAVLAADVDARDITAFGSQRQ